MTSYTSMIRPGQRRENHKVAYARTITAKTAKLSRVTLYEHARIRSRNVRAAALAVSGEKSDSIASRRRHQIRGSHLQDLLLLLRLFRVFSIRSIYLHTIDLIPAPRVPIMVPSQVKKSLKPLKKMLDVAFDFMPCPYYKDRTVRRRIYDADNPQT
ncbi:uncharacterized protein BO95DRAFT_263624 [Aspergillus brunneoviolaceus CBS 621.78]|uniref:Uncharacterized protein n=1 Tax=Aspergillus brunneoviolaceus CBS 621.78 TaxID=1450534 RepID=A0ACD1FX69_9EURO|nr:hypothetical protein BO95DRAFT_263624 [Aspergillus brunneoviolaceus CBS 621.78]RAH41550.1 hypothetical protein BO95DRAFT_263624 [Aspergillus brunneoviolaceus CBS 621.78]